jgi:energy-coupling factor transport system substrate-specific component
MSETGQASGFVDRVRNDFSTEAWVLIPVGVGINVVGGTIVSTLRVPLFMDVIGTILVAMLAGPWVAVVAGGLTNVVLGFTSGPQVVPFALVNVAIALAVGLLAARGWFRIAETIGYWRLFAAGVILAFVGTVTSAPISVFVFGGVTPGAQGAITAYFLASGNAIWTSVISASFVTEPIDKIASVIIAYFIAQSVPLRYMPRRGADALEPDA